MTLFLIFWGEDIVSRAWMVWTKPAMFFLWLGGNITPNEPTYLSSKQDSGVCDFDHKNEPTYLSSK